jgi:hypothetical protein
MELRKKRKVKLQVGHSLPVTSPDPVEQVT